MLTQLRHLPLARCLARKFRGEIVFSSVLLFYIDLTIKSAIALSSFSLLQTNPLRGHNHQPKSGLIQRSAAIKGAGIDGSLSFKLQPLLNHTFSTPEDRLTV